MSEVNTPNPADHSEGEIDLIGLVVRFWNKRRFILKITAVFVFFGLLIALFAPKEYSAGCIVVPQTADSKGMGSSLGGLAAMAGISLGSAGDGETLSPKVYDRVMNNVNFRKELMRTPIDFEGFDEPVSILDYYTKEEYRKFSLLGFLKKYTIGLPGVIIGAFRGDPEEIRIASGDNNSIQALTNEEQECLKILGSKYGINVNDKDGYVGLSASMPEPLAAAQVADRLKDLLQKYVTEFKIEKAQANYEFIKQRYTEAKQNFETRQDEYARFQDANRTLSSAVSRAREEQIKAEYNIANSLFTELSKQLIQAEIKVKEDTPILTVVEPVVVPREKSKPQRLTILVMFTLFGGFVGCGLVFAFDLLKKNSRIAFPKNWE